MLTLFFTFLIANAHAQLQADRLPVPGNFEIRGEFDYLTTTANFLSGGGSSVALPDNGKYTSMKGLGQFTFDLTEQARVYGGFSAVQASADEPDNVNNSSFTSLTTVNRSNFGFNEAWVGGQWWWTPGDLDVIPEAELIYPAWRVDQNSNNPLLGDGSLRLQVGSWLRYNFNEVIPYGYLGFAYRDEGRAGLLPYVLGVRYVQEKSFWLQGEVHGYETISNDSNTDNRGIRELYLARANGGSFQYYAINPSVAEVALTGGMHFGSLAVYVTGATTVMGHSSADSWSASAGIAFGGSFFSQTRREEPRTHFAPKPDKYDETLFRDTVTPAPPPPPASETPMIVERRRKPKPKRAKVVQQKPAADGPMPNVELLMKQTEKSLNKKEK